MTSLHSYTRTQIKLNRFSITSIFYSIDWNCHSWNLYDKKSVHYWSCNIGYNIWCSTYSICCGERTIHAKRWKFRFHFPFGSFQFFIESLDFVGVYDFFFLSLHFFSFLLHLENCDENKVFFPFCTFLKSIPMKTYNSVSLYFAFGAFFYIKKNPCILKPFEKPESEQSHWIKATKSSTSEVGNAIFDVKWILQLNITLRKFGVLVFDWVSVYRVPTTLYFI